MLLMRTVAGSALGLTAGIALSSGPPWNLIPAGVLMGAGILLIAGLWTPITGTVVALTEIWKMLMVGTYEISLPNSFKARQAQF